MADVLTDVGETWVVDRLHGSGALSASTASHVAVGTAAGTAAKADVEATLSEVGTRGATTVSQPSADVLRVVGTVTAFGGPVTITRAGIFDASSGGNLLASSDFTGIPLAAVDSIEITYDLEAQ